MDTYFCMVFFVLVDAGRVWRLMIPVGGLILLSQVFPTLIIIGNCCKNSKKSTSPLPKIETAAQLCLVRENMMLSTVLDSFCIDNFRIIFGQKIIMGRLMAILNFLLQDLPQTAIHWLFLVFVHTCVPHKDKTVKMSLICSCMAIMISLFNVIMIRPN